jgi:hypothetical protein
MKYVRVFVALLVGMLLLAGCETAPKSRVAIRRIEVNGDNAKYVGERFLFSLRARGVRISESIESGPIITAISTIKEMENNVSVFTFEATDGANLKIKEVVSTQDLPPALRDRIIQRGVGQAADALVRQLGPKEPTPAPLPPKTQNPEHFSTS